MTGADGKGRARILAAHALLDSRSAREGATLFLARLGPAAAQAGILVVAARLDGPRLVGLLSLGAIVGQYIATLADFGSGELTLLRGGQARRRLPGAAVLARSKLMLYSAGTLLMTLVAIWARIPLGAGLGGVFVGTASGTAPSITARLILRGRTRWELLCSWFDAGMVLGTTAVLVGMGYRGAGLLLFVRGLCGWAANALRLWGLRGSGPQEFDRPSWEETRSLLEESTPFFSLAIIVALFSQADALVLSAMAGPAAVGVYQFAWRLVYFMGTIGESLTAILLPRAAHWLSEGVPPRRVLRDGLLGFGTLGAVIALGMWVTLPAVLAAGLGEAFRASGDVVKILSVALGVRFFAYAAGMLITASDLQVSKVRAALLYTPLSLAAFALGATSHGAVGVAFARIFAEGAVLASYLVVIRRRLLRPARVSDGVPVAREGFFGELAPGTLDEVVRSATPASSIDGRVTQTLSAQLGADWSDRESEGSVKPACLAPIAHLLRGARVIDAGCGLGAITRWIAWAGGDVVGLDRVMERIRVARQRLSAADVTPARVAVADLVQMPVATASADVVTCVGVLEWVPAVGRRTHPAGEGAQVRVLREFARVLRPGGVALVAIENRYGLPYLLGRRDEHTGLRWVTLLPRWVGRLRCRVRGRTLAYTHSARGMRALATRAGFTVEEVYAVIPHYSCPTILVGTGPRWAEGVRLARRVAATQVARGLAKRWAWRVALGPGAWLTRRLAPSLVVVMRKPATGMQRNLDLPAAVVGPRGAGRSAHALWLGPDGGRAVRIPMSPRQNAWIAAAERAAAGLSGQRGRSASIPNVFAVGPTSVERFGALLFATSLLVDGQNVANRLVRGTWKRRRALARHVLQALAEAVPRMAHHHGDLSPVNLLFTADGGICILDWETSSAAPPSIDGIVSDLAFLGVAVANIVEPGRVGTIDSDRWRAPWETRLWPDVAEVWGRAEVALGLSPGTIRSAAGAVMARARERQRAGARTPLLD